MKFYRICKECGYSEPNKEPGNHFCPQCNKVVKFYKIELFDGSKPGDYYESK